ncbi:hypothetical protein [Phytoactinopolyspora halotolerans]|uniref:Uncharacterized protein n=1 Tax=Phytoactinopolyspora halotolerans TaxID=1981512 RepID=A0A6L9SFW6_9ACTN|nr:hypothetical protein [Phytoactinopolyspora halotolerans]NEE02970.1 hypothetical protein [Phytoactinopolyspora halotolerans]
MSTGPAGWRPSVAEPHDTGGESVCWLPQVCEDCGRLADDEPPTVCAACGASIDVP